MQSAHHSLVCLGILILNVLLPCNSFYHQQPQPGPCICPPPQQPLPPQYGVPGHHPQGKANEQPQPGPPGQPIPPPGYVPPQPGPPGPPGQYPPTQAAGYQPPYGQYAITQPMQPQPPNNQPATPDQNEDVYQTQPPPGPPTPATPSTPAYTGPEIIQAQAILRSTKGARGVIRFTQVGANGPVHVTGTISGITPGKHGFHIHEKGDLRGACKGAGGHYNPKNQPHGAPQDAQRHVGDLGNIEADPNGVAVVDITDNVISLTGEFSIVGRGVMVHGGEDDLGKGANEESKKTGNAGERIACGIIRTIDPYKQK